jgi:hypothetical protein
VGDHLAFVLPTMWRSSSRDVRGSSVNTYTAKLSAKTCQTLGAAVQLVRINSYLEPYTGVALGNMQQPCLAIIANGKR